MPRLHSHYENLRVARNAPPEVIRAAYRALSQRYHPDLNAEDAEANRIMTLINVAYQTLSNPALRAEHDAWIRTQEIEQQSEGVSPAPAPTSARPADHPVAQPDFEEVPSRKRGGWEEHLPFEVIALAKHLRRGMGWYSTGALALLVYFGNQSHAPTRPIHSSPVSSYQAPKPAPRPAYVRPLQAPNGRPWPLAPSYMSGYPRLNAGGHGEVTVDNTQSEADVFVKLMYLQADRPQAVRQFYIPGGQSFTAKGVSPGQYDVRYQVLSSGARLKTESFALSEVETDEGVNYQRMRMTLYKVRDGNMHTSEISEDEFE